METTWQKLEIYQLHCDKREMPTERNNKANWRPGRVAAKNETVQRYKKESKLRRTLSQTPHDPEQNLKVNG